MRRRRSSRPATGWLLNTYHGVRDTIGHAAVANAVAIVALVYAVIATAQGASSASEAERANSLAQAANERADEANALAREANAYAKEQGERQGGLVEIFDGTLKIGPIDGNLPYFYTKEGANTVEVPAADWLKSSERYLIVSMLNKGLQPARFGGLALKTSEDGWLYNEEDLSPQCAKEPLTKTLIFDACPYFVEPGELLTIVVSISDHYLRDLDPLWRAHGLVFCASVGGKVQCLDTGIVIPVEALHG